MITLDLMNARPRALAPKDLHSLSPLLTRALHVRGTVTIGIRFVSLEEIQALNRTFRRKNRPTDVLSFSAREETEAPVSPKKNGNKEDYWGDLAICPDYAKEEAARRALTLREELLRLITHGVLHLAGYDHTTEEEELKMFAIQEKIISALV